MDFFGALRAIGGAFDQAGVRYALIGGFAMAMHGVQRATLDLDFLLMLEDLDRAGSVLERAGYRRAFHNENVSHYVADQLFPERIDVLHAFRGPSLSMLARAESFQIGKDLNLPVVQVEDLIGLKIQALVNDPRREVGDWQDIRWLIETRAEASKPVDWELVGDYLKLFDMDQQQQRLRDWYDQTHGS